MRIIHFSDLHVWLKTPGTDLYPRRLLGLANLLLVRARSFPRAIQHQVCHRLAREDADAVLFSGDLTTTSQKGEFLFGRRMLNPLFEKYGDHFVAIPGNHDVYTPHALRKQHFEHRFLEYHQPNVFRRILSNELSVIGLDCSFPQALYARGRIEPAQLEKTEQLIEEEKIAGRSVLILCHYPIAYPPDKKIAIKCNHSHNLIGDQELRAIIDKEPVVAYLNGHLHVRWAFKMDHILNLNSGAAGKLGSKSKDGPGYIRFDVEDSQIKNLTIVHLKSPDFEEWVEKPMILNEEFVMSSA